MSSWTSIANKALDDAVVYQDINEILGNLIALKEFPKRLLLGGDPKIDYINTVFAITNDPVYVEIDGTNQAGAIYEVHFMGLVTSGDTGTLELVRDPGVSNANIVTKTFTNTALALIKSASFSLTTGVNQYAIRHKATTGGVASPYQAYGFALVQR